MKAKLLFITLLIFLASVSAAYALDMPPIATIIATPSTNVSSTVTVTIQATDVMSNAGLNKVELYYNNALNATNTCAGATTCTLTKTFVSFYPINMSFYGIAYDVGGNNKSTQTINVYFNGVNTPPVLSGLPDVSILEDSGYNANLTDLWNYATDNWTSPQNLVYTIINQTNTSVANCFITNNQWIDCNTTTQDLFGTTNVTVQAFDGVLAGNDTFVVTVTPVNDAPVFNVTIPDITFAEDTNYTLNISDYFYDIDNHISELTFTNPDLDNLTVSYSLAGNITQAFMFADPDFNGVLYINFTASDGINSSNVSNNVMINITPVNDAPYFEEDTLDDLDSQQIYRGIPFSHQFNASDIDAGDTITYYDNTTLFDIDLTTGWINFTANSTGNHTVLLNACDDSGASNNCTNTTWEFEVWEHPPIEFDNVAVSPASPAGYTENGTYNFSVDPMMSQGASGPEIKYDIDEMWLEFNGANYTGNYTGNTFYVYLQNLSVGNYTYRWHGNITGGLYYNTTWYNYSIVPGTPTLTLTIPASPIPFGNATNVSCSADTTQVTPVLTRNGTVVSNPDTSVLGAGTYGYNCSSAATANYVAANVVGTLVVDPIPAVVNLTLNGTDGDILLAPNGSIVNIVGTVITPSGGYIELYINNVLNTTGTGTISIPYNFTNGVIPVTVIYNATQNYSAAQETHYVYVGTSMLKSNFNPASGSTLNASSMALSFDTNINTSCRWALTDLAYSAMTTDFTTTGQTSHSGTVSGLVLGNNNVHVSCVNDTSTTNTDLSYFVQNIIEQGSVLINGATANNSILYSTTVDNGALQSVNATNSVINNSILTSCTVINSTVKNYMGTNCVVINSIVDPPSPGSDITGSTITGGSDVFNSNVTYSYVDDSNITNSNVNNSNITNDSEIIGSTVQSCTLNSAEVTGGAVCTSSSITNSAIDNATVTNAVINNGVISSGVIVQGNTTYNATASGPANISDLINLPPNAAYTYSPSAPVRNQNINFNAGSSSDPNTAGPYAETNLTYFWDFGDGTNATGVTRTHRYSTIGTKTVILTVTDSFGLQDTRTRQISVTTGGGGGGSGGGSGGGGGGSYAYTPYGREWDLNLDERSLEIIIFGAADTAKIIRNNATQEMQMTGIDRQRANFTINNVPYSLINYEIRKIDMDADGFYDVRVIFTANYLTRAQLRFDRWNEVVQGFTQPLLFNFTTELVVEEEPVEEIPVEQPPVEQPPVEEIPVEEQPPAEEKGFFAKLVDKLPQSNQAVGVGITIGIVIAGLIIYWLISLILL